MAKIKLTKTELKTQRDSLGRFDRFLPMLQLKKQQLQMEILAIDARIAEKEQRRAGIERELETWVKLFSEETEQSRIQSLLSLESVRLAEGNIAGVGIPVVTAINVTKSDPDLFATPSWWDDAIDVLDRLVRLRVELDYLREQRSLISGELRVVSQRVNLFEKVKIPECRENIRVIKIFLGDQQTASVVRGKLAKSKTEAYDRAELQ